MQEVQEKEGQQVNVVGKRKWVYAQKPTGPLHRRRTVLALLLLGIFYFLPFLKIDGYQALQLDVINLRFHLFGINLWPQDFFVFAIAMISGFLILASVTASFGRVFCGWVCPQTIFMETIFRPIEYLIEGNPNQQKRLDHSPWTFEKITKKLLKHSIYFAIAFISANTFLAYIIGVDELLVIISDPLSEHLSGFLLTLAFSFAFYIVFAYIRELVCIVACPYGRMQGVLLNQKSIIIAYDAKRGEPRGLKQAPGEPPLGDCIDCFQCVKVCPTGIDIRNGLQLECVNCAVCIDACNIIMDKIKRPRNLIKYASKEDLAQGRNLRFSFRMLSSIILTVVCATFLSLFIIYKGNLDVVVDRVGGVSYQLTPDKTQISNLYRVKILNKNKHDLALTIQALAPPHGQIKMIQQDQIYLKAESIAEFFFFLYIPSSEVSSRLTKVKLALVNSRGQVVKQIVTNFVGPLVFKKYKYVDSHDQE